MAIGYVLGCNDRVLYYCLDRNEDDSRQPKSEHIYGEKRHAIDRRSYHCSDFLFVPHHISDSAKVFNSFCRIMTTIKPQPTMVSMRFMIEKSVAKSLLDLLAKYTTFDTLYPQ